MFDIKKLLAKNLRFYRKQKKLSQEKIAELLNISTNYYCALENKKYFPSSELIDKICTVYNISPFQLFLGEHNSSPSQIISNEKLSNIKNEVLKTIEKFYN